MAIIPVNLARVSDSLRATITKRSLTRTQQDLLTVQQQLSTGKKLNTPSDNPADASVAMQLRKMLDQQASYATNLQFASTHLSEVDSAMSDLTDLLRQAQSVASQNVSSTVSADERTAAASVISALYNQALQIANRQLEGVYLFGADGGQAPYVEQNGGIRFDGGRSVLTNQFDDTNILPFMADGAGIFGGAASVIRSTADLTPALTLATRLADMRGAGGEGVRLGPIRLSNGTASKVIDLSHAETIGDVVTAINSAGVGEITASLTANGIQLSAGAADDISVTEVGGTTAADLGILTTTSLGAGVAVTGASVGPRITAFTKLADLRGGTGIDLTGLTLASGAVSKTIDLSSTTTVEDLINAINGSGTGAQAKINSDGTGIDIANVIQGLTLTVSENGGTTAAELGVAGSVGCTGVLANLKKLQQALAGNDQNAITTSAEALQKDLDQTIRSRGEVGAKAKDFEDRQQRLADQKLLVQSMLSKVEDVDYNEAVTQFQLLQTALQANLQTTGRLMNMSLLDFLQ